MKTILFLFLSLTFCMLTNSKLSFAYASLGLELWFQKMIPALLPFMILSGIVVRLRLTEKISIVLYPALGPLFRVRKNVIYCIMLGFLCGFPMGAKVTADMLEHNLLTQKEGEYLLAFCNNIGPIYFCSFVLPLLGRQLTFPYLFGMYGIPLLYGILLRYTLFKNVLSTNDSSVSFVQKTEILSHPKNICLGMPEALDESVAVSLQSILTLGGYMILFNLLNLIPHMILGKTPVLFAPLFEITGGLSILGGKFPLYGLMVLSFVGLSCIAQTYSCIRKTNLSITNYIFHKVILTILTGVFYLGWFLFSPESFLR